MENDVFVLLLGANAGAYALAAAFAEYGIPVTVMDGEVPNAFYASKHVQEVRRVPGIEYDGLLMRALSDFYEAHAGKSLLLLPTTEKYTERVLANREVLERMFLLPNKKWQKAESTAPSPDALLLVYVGRTGALCAAYGKVTAKTEDGEPLAVVTEEAPSALLADIDRETPHFALYGVKENGACVALLDEDALSPLLAFSTAADLSLAEWMLTDYVSCGHLPEASIAPSGLFTLFSYGKTKKHFLPQSAKCAKALHRRRLCISLFTGKSETKNPLRRRILKRFYREFWQKKTKNKK